MISIIKQTIWFLIRKSGLGFLCLRFYPKSILRNDGWYNSFKKNLPVDKNNNPIPWYSYSAIKFIEDKINPQMRVFEYGCGYSSAWYSTKVNQIISVENDLKWSNKIKKQFNIETIIHKEKVDDYINEILNHGLFDIIIIDGINRSECLEPALKSLTDNGIIIWDNSDRDDLQRKKGQLTKNGFKEIKFYGITPSTFISSWTSIFYRENNIFDI